MHLLGILLGIFDISLGNLYRFFDISLGNLGIALASLGHPMSIPRSSLVASEIVLGHTLKHRFLWLVANVLGIIRLQNVHFSM